MRGNNLLRKLCVNPCLELHDNRSADILLSVAYLRLQRHLAQLQVEPLLAPRGEVRGSRQSPIQHQNDLTFDDLCAAIRDHSPVLVNVQNSGAVTDHWVVVYGYGRKPNRVFIATNGMPLITSNAIALRRFSRIWSPRGNGLICDYPKRSANRVHHAASGSLR
jgi:hypothetical protein